MNVRKLQIENETLRTEQSKSMDKIKEMNRILNFEKVNLESSKQNNMNKMQDKVEELERKLKMQQNHNTIIRDKDQGQDLMTKKDKKMVNQDLYDEDFTNLIHKPCISESKVSEDDTNEFLLIDDDKLDSFVIQPKSNLKLELKDIQENKS